MLAHIFKKLRRQSDHRRIQKVCPRWAAVVDETVGVRKKIGMISQFWENQDPCDWGRLEDIKKFGISHAMFSDAYDISQFCSESDIVFGYPNLVRKLEFDGIILTEIFKRLCLPLSNLSTLILHVSSLSHLKQIEHIFNHTWSQSIQRISITSEGFGRSHFQIYDMQGLYDNFLSICNFTFPRLKAFQVMLPVFLDKEVELFVRLASFFDRHYETLEEQELRFSQRYSCSDTTFSQSSPLADAESKWSKSMSKMATGNLYV